MPTTSSPWASPSSPAGRRLLQSEPATADGIPVLDEATLAQGAALVAASDARVRVAAPAALAAASGARSRGAAPAARPRAAAPGAAPGGRRRRPPIGRGLVAAALVIGLLSAGTGAGTDRPGSAATPATPTTSTAAPAHPVGLGRAAGTVMGAEPRPVGGGDVAVGLIEPVTAMRAEGTPGGSSLAGRLGTLAVLAAEDAAAG